MAFCEPQSARTDWETPPNVFAPLNEEFHFQTDVCAFTHNAKCSRYFVPTEVCGCGGGCDSCDGLSKEWSGMCWMNPPYGKEIAQWVKKAYDSACAGDATVVCLLPVRSNNDWWKYVIQSEVRFIRPKVQFVGATNVSMFPNVIAIFYAHLDPGGIMKVWDIRK